jgi:hypothetical protein
MTRLYPGSNWSHLGKPDGSGSQVDARFTRSGPGRASESMAVDGRQDPVMLEMELLARLGNDRDARITARYYGLDGNGGASLQVTGDEFGLTRERVRQISNTVVNRLDESQLRVPALDRAIAFIAGRVPAPAGPLELELQTLGFSGMPFRIEGLVAAARLFGRKLAFAVAGAGEKRVVHERDVTRSLGIARIARRAVSRWGMSSIAAIAKEAKASDLGEDSFETIRRTLQCQPDIAWLDEFGGWFCVSGSRGNRVTNRIRKILAVADPIPLAALMKAVRRNYRTQGFGAPRSVLEKFCSQTDGLQVDNELVRAIPRIDPDAVLTPVEKAIVGILAANGGVMTRASLVSACQRRGLNRVTVGQNLLYSPILMKHVSGVYGLVGTF